MDPSEMARRLSLIEKRLSQIEAQLKLQTVRLKKTPASSAQPINLFTDAAKDFQDESIPAKESLASPKPGGWLGIIAVACFVMAAGFIIKLSIDAGWLTPLRQAGLATFLGFSLIGAGLFLQRADRAYAGYLPGAGIIILYLTVFAAHRYYNLISFEAGMGLSALVSGLCIWLYLLIRHEIYPLTAAVGAYVAPLILGLGVDAVYSLDHFVICSIAFAIVTVFLQTRLLSIVSAYLAVSMTALVGLDLHQDKVVAVLLVVQFFIFVANSYIYTWQTKKPLTEYEAFGFLPIMLLFYAVEYYLIDRLYPGMAPWTSLSLAAALIVIYTAARMHFSGYLGSHLLVTTFSTAVLFHSVYLELLPASVHPWLFVLIISGAVLFQNEAQKLKNSSSYTAPLMACFAVLVIEYLAMLNHLWVEGQTNWIVVSLASVASLWFALLKYDAGSYHREVGEVLLGATHVLSILALYRLALPVGSLAVSASWLFYAVAIMVFAFYRRDELFARSALYVLGFSAAKALLIDASSAPTAIRILCLLLTGAVLYGCGFFMRKIGDWHKQAS